MRSPFLLLVASLAAMAGMPQADAAKQVDPSRDGRIAFVSERDGNGEIYVMNADGSGQERLTNNPAIDSQPAWSPDGTRIAFISQRDGDFEIYVMNADGSGLERLTTSAKDDLTPAWSPDGRRIAFSSDRDAPDTGEERYDFEIYLMNADGSGVEQVTDASGYDTSPAWSPDGNSIAFDTGPCPCAFEDFDIHVMNPDGTGRRELTPEVGTDFAPDWSPDGSKLAFTSIRDGSEETEIYVMNLDSSALQQLTNDPAEDLDSTWSPDGRRIAFESNRDGNYEIYAMNADGSEPTRLTQNLASDGQPAWQPPPPEPSVSGRRTREGEPAIFTVTLTSKVSAPVGYNYETQSGKAKAGKDFTSKEGVLTFRPGDTRGKIRVKTRDDGAAESKETFFLEVSYPGSPSDRGKATITDDD